jgi:two-component system NtrC family sensor kinase
MIKHFTVTIFFLSLAIIGFGQTRHVIDSLRHILHTAKDDTGKINAQIRLCYVYRLGNTDSALFYGQEALKASEKINYLQGDVQVRGFMAVTMEQLGDLPQALGMAFKAIQIAKENNLETKTTPSLNAIGETYIILKDYSRAIHYFKTQEALDVKLGIEEGLAYALYDTGNAYDEMNELDSAYYYEQKAIKIFAKTGRKEPIIYKILGDIALKKGDKQGALKQYQQCLQIAIINNESRATGFAYNKIAAFYKNENQSDSAIYYASKGLRQSEAIGKKLTSMEAAGLLSELYEQKDPKEALRYLKIANVYKESLFGANNINAVQTLVAQEEEHQKEIEANRVNYQNKLKLYALIAGLGILFLVALILYRNNRQKQRANRVLVSTLDDLKATQTQLVQSEKMASLGELTAGIAHEIQNPLNFVNNFSEVNTEMLHELEDELKNGNADEALALAADIIKNEEKINHHGKRADFIVKGMLEHSRTSTGEKQPTDLNVLCDEFMKLSYHGLRAKDKIFNAELITNFDNKLPKANLSQQDIGRVMLNLFNNAFYAVNQKQKTAGVDYKPEVTVTTFKPPLGGWGLKVHDNGNGIPNAIKDKIMQPFFTTKPTGEGTGLGLSLSYDIVVKGHGGSITVDSKEGEYTEFIITMPLN